MCTHQIVNMGDKGISKRAENYSNNDEIQLCRSWMHISQDPIVGTGQQKGRFWERILQHYTKALGEGKFQICCLLFIYIIVTTSKLYVTLFFIG